MFRNQSLLLQFVHQYFPLLKLIPILVPLIHISLTASVYTTVAVAVERYTTLIDVLKKV